MLDLSGLLSQLLQLVDGVLALVLEIPDAGVFLFLETLDFVVELLDLGVDGVNLAFVVLDLVSKFLVVPPFVLKLVLHLLQFVSHSVSRLLGLS